MNTELGEEAWDPKWRAILQHLLEQQGDPFQDAIVSYGGSLNSETAEPYETVAILRSNARFALKEIEDGMTPAGSWEVWAFLELESRHCHARMAALKSDSEVGVSQSTITKGAVAIGVAWAVFGLLGDYGAQLAAVMGISSLIYVGVALIDHVMKVRQINRLSARARRFDRAASLVQRQLATQG